MNSTLRTPYPLALHLLCLLPLILLLALLWLHFGNEEAAAAFFMTYAKEHARLTRAVDLFSDFGNALFYPVYAFLFWLGMRRRKPELARFALACVLAQIFVSAFFSHVCKMAVGRPRPMTGGPFMPLSPDSGHHSFPSGHTTEILGAALPLVQRYQGIAFTLLLGLYVAAMGFSRVYLGMHYLSDVAGGSVFGSLAGWLAWRFFHLPQGCWHRWIATLPCCKTKDCSRR